MRAQVTQGQTKAVVQSRPVASNRPAVLRRPSLLDSTQFVKAGYYGNIGSAKTSNLAAMARLGKVIYIDSEAGLEKKPLADLGIPVENIIPFTDISYAALDDLQWELREHLHRDPTSIAGVAFDSMTEIVAKLVEQTNDDEIGRQIAKKEKRGEDTSDLSIFRIDISSWGIVTEQVRRLIRHYRDLPCHMGWAALERRDVDKNTGVVSYGPKVNPGLQGDLTAYVGIVMHTWVDGEDDKEQELFVAHTRPTGNYTAKDRFHATPRRLAVPSFDRVVGYVNNDLTVKTDPIQQHYHEVLRARRSAAARQQTEDEGTGDADPGGV
jgi:hypothetical protein